jgi:hypothetical protein
MCHLYTLRSCDCPVLESIQQMSVWVGSQVDQYDVLIEQQHIVLCAWATQCLFAAECELHSLQTLVHMRPAYSI